MLNDNCVEVKNYPIGKSDLMEILGNASYENCDEITIICNGTKRGVDKLIAKYQAEKNITITISINPYGKPR